eukprot:SAG22_NODE_1655_length_3892_cov_2.729765_3_plen_202_part_00
MAAVDSPQPAPAPPPAGSITPMRLTKNPAAKRISTSGGKCFASAARDSSESSLDAERRPELRVGAGAASCLTAAFWGFVCRPYAAGPQWGPAGRAGARRPIRPHGMRPSPPRPSRPPATRKNDFATTNCVRVRTAALRVKATAEEPAGMRLFRQQHRLQVEPSRPPSGPPSLVLVGDKAHRACHSGWHACLSVTARVAAPT